MPQPHLPPALEPAPSLLDRVRALFDEESVARRAVTIVASIALVGGAALLWLRGPPQPTESGLQRAATTLQEPERGEAIARPRAHAAGAVNRPGVYVLPAGARVEDLITAAGGATPDADVDQLNLAALVADGERVYVPRRGEVVATQAPAGAETGEGAGPIINLNSATAEQLEELPGIGPSTARAIVEHRNTHGPFREVDELLQVRGIGDAKLDQIRELVIV